MIKIHSQGGKVYEGELFAIDPVTKALVIKVDGAYTIFNPSQIAKIEGDVTLRAPPVAELGISIASFEKREQTALKAAEKAIAGINNKVDNDVQSLFDKLSMIYPCAWQDNSIVVLDEYVIDPPYTTIVVKPGRDGSGIERLSKILEGERKKLKLEG